MGNQPAKSAPAPDRVPSQFAGTQSQAQPTHLQPSQQFSPQIAIIGGGPVGLFTAIELGLNFPKAKITIYEKREQYVREHHLRIDPESLADHYPDNEKWNSLIKWLCPDISTKLLEQKLKSFICEAFEEDNHLRIVTQEVKSESENKLLSDLDFPDLVIAADGRNSRTRKMLFSNSTSSSSHSQAQVQVQGQQQQQEQREDTSLDLDQTQVLAHAMQLKFYVQHEEEKCITKCKLKQNLNRLAYTVDTSVGRMRDGQTPITCFIPVSEEVYDRSSDCTSQNICQLVDVENVDIILQEDIKSLLKEHYENKQQNLKISRVKLEIYRSKFFAKMLKSRGETQSQTESESESEFEAPILFVGDAAFGVPFMKALNYGFRCSLALIKTIKDAVWAPVQKQKKPKDSNQQHDEQTRWFNNKTKAQLVKAYSKKMDDFWFAAKRGAKDQSRLNKFQEGVVKFSRIFKEAWTEKFLCMSKVKFKSKTPAGLVIVGPILRGFDSMVNGPLQRWRMRSLTYQLSKVPRHIPDHRDPPDWINVFQLNVAIIGDHGSGKSSLVRALMGQSQRQVQVQELEDDTDSSVDGNGNQTGTSTTGNETIENGENWRDSEDTNAKITNSQEGPSQDLAQAQQSQTVNVEERQVFDLEKLGLWGKIFDMPARKRKNDPAFAYVKRNALKFMDLVIHVAGEDGFTQRDSRTFWEMGNKVPKIIVRSKADRLAIDKDKDTVGIKINNDMINGNNNDINTDTMKLKSKTDTSIFTKVQQSIEKKASGVADVFVISTVDKSVGQWKEFEECLNKKLDESRAGSGRRTCDGDSDSDFE